MEHLDFGKYNFYIWVSYSVTFLVLIMNIIMPVLAKKKILKSIKRKMYLNEDE